MRRGKKKSEEEGTIRNAPSKLSRIPSTRRAQIRHRRVLKSLGGIR